MATELRQTDVSPDVIADADLIAQCVGAGEPVPADIAQRIHERAEKITERLRARHGVLDIGVPAIRELRGELPGP